MAPRAKVLAITKRPADLCATQNLLYAAGLELVTATNLAIVGSVIRAFHIQGVIVCRHSWTDQERESIVADLATHFPELSIIVRCVGCTKCEEHAGRAGVLETNLPLTQLIATVVPALEPKASD